eukprot:NODE_3442_length_975_cov_26.730022_g3164_i0.p1 GENE.NODE_3442_length_975_cov_26.730022_g3164_i0~~NODE_3442_length_975_cov_26.730022_g3164_i0.p1  ORF type:complete len:134 (-),score=26.13 NODE_3442_length_975_cov_26.730022_g3164_i0:59-460(-)
MGIASYIELIVIIPNVAPPEGTLSSVVVSTAIDVLIYFPTMIAAGMSLYPLIQGKDCDYVKDKFRSDYLWTCLAALLFWLPLDLIQFTVIPTAYHVVYVKTADLFALTGLSYFLNKMPDAIPLEALSNVEIPH